MSRNLCIHECYYCDEPVTLEEPQRLITREEAGRYLDEYRLLMVAKAHCDLCEAKYLAWMHGIYWIDRQWKHLLDPEDRRPMVAGWKGPVPDLSFRSTFNDEPGPEDLPKFKIGKVRIGPWEDQ